MEVSTLSQGVSSVLSYSRFITSTAVQWLGQNVTAVLKPETSVARAVTNTLANFQRLPVLSRVIACAIPAASAFITAIAFETARFAYNEYHIAKLKNELSAECKSGKTPSDIYAKTREAKLSDGEYGAIIGQYDRMAREQEINKESYDRPVTSMNQFLATTVTGGLFTYTAIALTLGSTVAATFLPVYLIGSGITLATKTSARLFERALYAYRIRRLNEKMCQIECSHGDGVVYLRRREKLETEANELRKLLENLKGDTQFTANNLKEQIGKLVNDQIKVVSTSDEATQAEIDYLQEEIKAARNQAS